MSRKQDTDGNVVIRANSNPILDTCTYNVEFEDGDVTKFTANVMTENMYSQCDAEGNQYILLDKILYYCKDGHALTAQDQKIVVNG